MTNDESPTTIQLNPQPTSTLLADKALSLLSLRPFSPFHLPSPVYLIPIARFSRLSRSAFMFHTRRRPSRGRAESSCPRLRARLIQLPLLQRDQYTSSSLTSTFELKSELFALVTEASLSLSFPPHHRFGYASTLILQTASSSNPDPPFIRLHLGFILSSFLLPRVMWPLRSNPPYTELNLVLSPSTWYLMWHTHSKGQAAIPRQDAS